MQLRPYQDEAADFLYEHDRAMILAPVGAGKTALTLAAMEAMVGDGHVRRWLVVAPKRVCREVWPVEGRKWAPALRLALALGSPKQRQDAFRDALAGRADVVVTNYDNLPSAAEHCQHFDGIVFDELTRLKNPSGKRYKALEKVIAEVGIRWGLTGSFTSNGLEDVFGQCKIVDQKLLGRSKGAFLQQYFYCINRDYGQWAPRDGALEEVMKRIKPHTYVLEPGEYSDTLPPCHMVEIRCALDDRAPYEKMKRDYVARLGNETVIAQSAAAVTSKLQQMASGFAYNGNSAGIWYSSHKFERLDEIIVENQRANTLIVYNYLEELAELKRRYPQAQTLDDEDAVVRWNRGEIEHLLVHPKSAGHGLNLQHGGCRIVFVSLPWSLELFEQTVGRLHRSGQKHDVWCYVLMATDTVDERIWASLHDKRAISTIALEELRNV